MSLEASWDIKALPIHLTADKFLFISTWKTFVLYSMQNESNPSFFSSNVFCNHVYIPKFRWLQMANCFTKIFFFLWRYSPNLGLDLPPWNSPFHFVFLDLRRSVGPLGRVISSSQGLYLHTNTEKRTHTNTTHPCPDWDSNSRSQLPNEQRQYMP
jgi:hypothetical protein